MNKLSLAALVVAALALGHSIWVQTKLGGDLKAASETALQDREKELIAHFLPRVNVMIEQMRLNPYSKNPQTIEELMVPVTEFFEKIGELPEQQEKDPCGGDS